MSKGLIVWLIRSLGRKRARCDFILAVIESNYLDICDELRSQALATSTFHYSKVSNLN